MNHPSRMAPGDPQMGANRYRVTATNTNALNHGKKRIAISYIYLLILRELRSRNVIRVNALLETVEPTLQARTAGGGNQAAHQLLRELTTGRICIYNLVGATPDEKKALVYCTSAVSNIPKIYNDCDSQLELAIRPAFLRLAMSVVSSTPPDNVTIWNTLISDFITACLRAKLRPGVTPAMATELDNYIAGARFLQGRAAVTARDAAYWLQKINAGGIQDL